MRAEPAFRRAAYRGYGSEGALSVAFKRVLGMPPGDYRRHPMTTSRSAYDLG
ncbi:hypothetical protein [Nonomuraea deserti]|uniref:hypothetical protein n=1 Tax=Nonomuraea deserti TaxID=1848322 RepID=UPI0015F2B1CA|nr:hypothetical protein [Nonomuraea deserti]